MRKYIDKERKSMMYQDGITSKPLRITSGWRMKGNIKQWSEECEATALEIVRNQVMARHGYLHELGNEGVIEPVKWATRNGGKRHCIVTPESTWITNIPQVAEELRGIVIKKKRNLEQAARKRDTAPHVGIGNGRDTATRSIPRRRRETTS